MAAKIIDNLMAEVDAVIVHALKSNVVLINQLATYIIKAGGKRLRPRLTILGALACEYNGQQHLKLAAIIEFIHTATLLHDDVVDASNLRRGQQTANAVFGNQAAVLTGDFLYSRSFQMMTELGDLSVMQLMADTTNIIAEGEVMQLMQIQELDLTIVDYMDIIYRKTAKFFATACSLGAIIGHQPTVINQALTNYGQHLGMAFQIIDDVLDYQADSSVIGKNTGDDLAEGKVTLPLIYALQHGNLKQRQLIEATINNADDELLNLKDNISPILAILQDTNALTMAMDQAKAEINSAIQSLEPLNESIYKQELINITELSLNRLS